MYIFYGNPKELVKTRKKVKMTLNEYKWVPLFRFDENGEYRTNDPELIEKLKKKFKYVNLEEEKKVKLKKEEK